MKKSIFVLSLFFIVGSAFSQKVKIGEFSDQDISLTEVSFEKDADAVVLWEQGQSKFFSGLLETTYFFRTKILKESGKDRGDVRIAYYVGDDRYEDINGIKATVTNFVNGKPEEEKVGKENIFDVEIGDGWREARITFPNVQVGSILEYTYKKSDKNITLLDGWTFQNDIPTLASTYEITIIPQLDYRMIGQGEKYFTTTEKVASNGVYSWTLRDLHSLKEEPYMKNYNDYKERVEFQLAAYQAGSSGGYNSGPEWKDVLSNWIVLGNEVLADYKEKGYFRSNPIEKEFLSVDFSGETEEEKAQKAYYFFQDNFALKDDGGFWPDQWINQLLKSKSGTPEELNLALMGVLKSMGIECAPVLIGSKGNGRSNLVPFPFLKQFNEIILIAKLDGKDYYLDLSDPIAPFGYVGLNKHVKAGLLLVKDQSSLIPIEIKHSSNTIMMTDVNISEENIIEMNNTLRTFYYEGLKVARVAKSLKDDNEPLEKLFKEQDGITFSDVEMVDDLQEKNYISTKFKMTKEIGEGETLIAINPLTFTSYSKNPFTQEYRVFPVDFGFAFAETYNAKINIPEGYELDDYPLAERITIPGNAVAFSYSSTAMDGVVNIVAKFEVKNPFIEPVLYPDLKFFMEAVASKLSAPVILKKVAIP